MTVIGLARVGPDPLVGGLAASIAHAAEELGIEALEISSPEDERRVDVLLIVGYPRAYAAFLLAPRASRRIAWFGEPLPRPGGEERTTSTRAGPILGGGLRLLKRGLGPMTRRTMPGPIGRMREAAAIAEERVANLADALWCSTVVDRVVVTSRDRARVLRRNGLDPAVVPFGYHAAGSGRLTPPEVDRDVAVAILASGVRERRLRRGRMIARIVPRLESLGQGPILRLDGVWGPERDAILGRTKVVLDIQRVPGNFTGIRFLTAMAAGAVLVAEPLDDPHPFVPGVDHIEVPEADLIDAIAALLDDEPRRRALAATAQARLARDLSMRTSLERVLAA